MQFSNGIPVDICRDNVDLLEKTEDTQFVLLLCSVAADGGNTRWEPGRHCDSYYFP